MYCHEEFTAQEIEDILREEARKRAQAGGHAVMSEANFLRAAEVELHGETKDDPPPRIGGATVSWKSK